MSEDEINKEDFEKLKRTFKKFSAVEKMMLLSILLLIILLFFSVLFDMKNIEKCNTFYKDCKVLENNYNAYCLNLPLTGNDIDFYSLAT